MSITDLEKDLKFPSPSQSDSNFGHGVSTKFIGDEETIQTMNVLTKYDIHVLEYVKFCMTKYHHEVFLVICERRANYIKKYRLQHINKPKKTHQQPSYLKNHLRRRKLSALYESGQDYDESYFNNDDQNDNDDNDDNDNNNDVSELDYHLSRDADDTANLSEALRVISKGIDKISVLIKEKEKEKQDAEYQELLEKIINISLCLLLFVFTILALFVIVIINTFSQELIKSI
jgi:hypothetical protein